MSLSQPVVQESPHTLQAFENDKGYFIKTFLLDDSIAKNGMGVQPDYIPKHINKFVGKPVILTPSFYHPHEFEHYKETGDYIKDLEEYSKLQKPYIIGTISSVDTSSNLQQAGGTNYSAILKIEDEKAIAAFKQGKIPLYVSPSVYRVNSKDPVHSITDYEPLHIAVVDNPAYGFHKANIRANCEGNVIECSRMLTQASNGLYCVEKKLSELTNLLQASDSPNSSYVGNSTLNTSVHALSNNNTNENANSQSVQEQSNVQEQKQETVEQKIQEQQQKAQVTPINTPFPNISAVQDNKEVPKTEEAQSQTPAASENTEETPCDKARSEYESKISELENDIKSFKEFKANYEKTAAETKLQTKKSRIENVVPVGYAGSEEERNKAVESLMNVADEQLDIILNSFVVPATRNIKQGGLKQRQRVTDFVKPQEKQVAQASVSKLGAKDIENLEKILNFGYGGIVPKKNNSGGIA